MDFCERPGEGKFSIASRDHKAGELVHVSRSISALPNVARLVDSTCCPGCLIVVAKNPRQAPSSNSTNSETQDGNDNDILKHCPSCSIRYCSQRCRDENAASHASSGECAVVTGVLMNNRVPDNILLFVSAVIARGVAEGYPIPTTASSSSSSSSTMPQPMPEFETVEEERQFLQAQPREDIVSKFPDVFANHNCAADVAAGQGSQQQEEQAAAERRSLIEAISIPAPLQTAAGAAADAASAGGGASAEAAASASTMNSSSNSDEQDTLIAATIQREEAERIAALQRAPAPSFRDFCQLVSLLTSLDRASFNEARQCYLRYRNMAQRVRIHEEQNQDNAPPASSPSSPSRFLVSDIDPLFFMHVWATFYSNFFGVYDAWTDTSIAGFCAPDASYFNHSCAPNLIRRRHKRHGECFYAMTDIARGQPLTIDYSAVGDFAHVSERREHLMMYYRFWCLCPLCLRDEAAEERGNGGDDDDGGAAGSQNQQDEQHENQQDEIQPHHQPSNQSGVMKRKKCRVCAIEGGGDLREVYASVNGRWQRIAYECRFCYTVSKQAHD